MKNLETLATVKTLISTARQLLADARRKLGEVPGTEGDVTRLFRADLDAAVALVNVESKYRYLETLSSVPVVGPAITRTLARNEPKKKPRCGQLFENEHGEIDAECKRIAGHVGACRSVR